MSKTLVEQSVLRERLIREIDACLLRFYTSKDVPEADDHSSTIQVGLGPVVLIAYAAECQKMIANTAAELKGPEKLRKWVFVYAMVREQALNWAKARGLGNRWTWVSQGSYSAMLGHNDYCFVNLAPSYNLGNGIAIQLEQDITIGRAKLLKPADEIPFVS